jgi:hypothetical protein
MKFYYPGMTGAQPDEGILLDESRLKFVVARKVALVQDFNRILMFGDTMGGLHDLRGTPIKPRSVGVKARYVLWNRTPPLKYHQS